MKTRVQWEKVLAEQVVLPTRNRWSRRAIAQYLASRKYAESLHREDCHRRRTFAHEFQETQKATSKQALA
jgi:hypothetical protein